MGYRDPSAQAAMRKWQSAQTEYSVTERMKIVVIEEHTAPDPRTARDQLAQQDLPETAVPPRTQRRRRGSGAGTVTNNDSSQTMKVAPLMRQVRYDRFGGVDQLWIDEVSMPEDSPGQAVVRVYASCINPGSVPATLHGASYTPIRDLAGVVVSVGDGVQDVKIETKYSAGHKNGRHTQSMLPYRQRS
jgi:hypothetical protein